MTLQSLKPNKTFPSHRIRCGRWIWMIPIILLGGCAPAGVIFAPLEQPLFWPLPPERPRIHYVGQIESSDDLQAPKTLGEVFFGGRDNHTMLSPYALCTDSRDRLLVADSNGQMVHVFDLKKRTYASWTIQDEDWSLTQPVGILYDARGRVLVSDSVSGTLFVFSGVGKFLGTLGAQFLARPTGIVEDRVRGRLYVADPGTHTIVVMDLDGHLLHQIGRRGIKAGQFNFPTNVAVDSLGRLYVSDSLNFRIQVFSPDFEPIRQFGGKGDMPGYFQQPKGLALDSSDQLYVVDARFEAVQVFDDEGTLLLPFGQEGSGPGEFWLPAGIHIDKNDRLWIADSYNRRVQVFDYRSEEEP